MDDNYNAIISMHIIVKTESSFRIVIRHETHHMY
jgi:hypothetical protein